SSLQRPACSSIRSRRTRSSMRCARPRLCLPRIRPPALRRKSTTSGFRRRRWRRFSSEPLEVREPDLDEGADGVLESCLARGLERLFGEALESILATDDRLEVVGHAGDGAEAVQLALSLDPDVILMDISMPVMDGFQATQQIRRQRRHACILMLTGSDSRTDLERA